MVVREKLSDEEIVHIVRTDDKNAYAYIIRRYEKKLLRYAEYLIGDESLAADAVQEGFIKAYININSFTLSLSFSSWLYRIVHNQAINLLQKNKKYFAFPEGMDLDSGVHLEDDLIQKELFTHLHTCIEEMPVMYKSPLILFFLEEKSYEEISDILRVPIGTVGTRLNRAKHLVRKICQKKKK